MKPETTNKLSQRIILSNFKQNGAVRPQIKQHHNMVL